MPTLPCTGASARTMTAGSNETRTRSPCAAAMPSSSSRRTLSGSLMSFFIGWLPGEEQVEGQRAEDAADDRPDDRHPGVAPVRRALAGDREDGVHDPRAEVARRVDRIAGRPAE